MEIKGMKTPAGPALLIAAIAFSQALAAEAPALSAKDRAAIDRLIDRAGADDRAFEIVESLTTEVGPRLGGTEAEARARDWGVRTMKALGFKNVRIETYEMPAWSRVSEKAAIISPFPQPLHVTALGNSLSTPEGGVTAKVARFETLTALQQAPMTGLEGKIVFVDERMMRTQDGSSYGLAVAKRSEAAYEAAKRGASAVVIRSVGTDSHRNPHTGNMKLKEGEATVPAAALSNPDADQLARALARGAVRLTLDIKTARVERASSGNVIGEIPGRTDEIIVIGGHLDSWDLGTGAVDDGAGIAITLAAAKLIDEMKGKPGRTIRVVLWGAEEVGLHGATAYAEAHKGELERHALAAESDFGAGRVWSLRTKFGAASSERAALFAEALRPLGVALGSAEASGGADVGPLKASGVPVIDLYQDGTDYFDLHHTPDDTLDKIDPRALKQNVAAWAAALYLAAETPGGFRD
jgi:Zn-dependent M28 family amino/carboxypeptidase